MRTCYAVMETKMPKMDPIEILEKINRGKLTLLTIDTEVIVKDGTLIGPSRLDMLSQFSSSKNTFVLSEIVVRETIYRIKKIVDGADNGIKEKIKNIGNVRDVDTKELEEVASKITSKETSQEHADKVFEDFREKTSAQIIEASDHITIDDLLSNYFGNIPPFDVEKQRKEFPDAIALHVLNSYADQIKRYMIAVSGDNAWESYCASSDWLVHVKDLGKALEYFDQRSNVIISTRFASFLQNEDTNYAFEDLDEKASSYIDKMDINIIAKSYVYYEYNDIEFDLRGNLDMGSDSIYFVNYDEQEKRYTFEAKTGVVLELSANFIFKNSKEDEGPKLGPYRIERNFVKEGLIRIYAFEDMHESFNIDGVEFVDMDSTFDFGFVHPEAS